MELRRIFDTIPDQFDRYRPRYSRELFDHLINYAGIGPDSEVLEIGPGTGQATDPVLKTGCSYCAIELGENLCAKMTEKYGSCPNFRIINGDFITHDFGGQRFDMVYAAAAMQWIPEETAFTKTFSLLKPGGVLAMILTRSDYRTPNEGLYNKIQKLYDIYFKPEIPYTHGPFRYENALNYGYTDWRKQEFHTTCIYTADEYVAFCGTHCDHIVTPEPYKSKLFAGLHQAVMDSGNRIEVFDTHVLMTVKKMQLFPAG